MLTLEERAAPKLEPIDDGSSMDGGSGRTFGEAATAAAPLPDRSKDGSNCGDPLPGRAASIGDGLAGKKMGDGARSCVSDRGAFDRTAGDDPTASVDGRVLLRD